MTPSTCSCYGPFRTQCGPRIKTFAHPCARMMTGALTHKCVGFPYMVITDEVTWASVMSVCSQSLNLLRPHCHNVSLMRLKVHYIFSWSASDSTSDNSIIFPPKFNSFSSALPKVWPHLLPSLDYKGITAVVTEKKNLSLLDPVKGWRSNVAWCGDEGGYVATYLTPFSITFKVTYFS